jgi:TadE-like protein
MASRLTVTRARGQALVETLIVIPIVLFVILGALQLMLVQHARVMTSYAAYAAARAGIVNDANWNVMRNAALVASLPLYGRTDGLGEFLRTWGKVKAAAEITEAVDTGAATLERLAESLLGVSVEGLAQDVSLIELRVKTPADLFERAREWRDELDGEGPPAAGALAHPDDGRELDVDDPRLIERHPELGRLVVELRLLYPLRIPLVNKLMFELWLAQSLLGAREVNSSFTDWLRFRARLEGGASAGSYLDDAVRTQTGEGPLDDFFTTSQWVKELRTLRTVAERHGLYLVPLHASYAMQMQSSWFSGSQREPVWFEAN